MATPEALFSKIEGVIGSLPGAGQSVALWVKQIKEVMLCGANARATDWAFIGVPDMDESGTAAGGCAPEDGAVLYGVVFGQKSADASIDIACITNDADGTVTYAAADAISVPTFMYQIPAAAVDLTEEFWPFIFPKGIAFANFMSFGADGADGTNVDTDDLRAFAVYRTGTSILQA